MWKKWLAFASMLALVILLDPTHTPAQPDNYGKGGKGGKGKGPRPDGNAGDPGATAPGGKGRDPGGFGGTGGMGGNPGMGNPGMGGGRGFGGPADPEKTWGMLQRLTEGNGETIDLSKIPVGSRPWLQMAAEKSGGLVLPESGVWTKDNFLEFHAKSEAAKAAFVAMGGGQGNPFDPNGLGRGRGGMGPNGGWGPNGWDPSQGPGGWDPSQFGPRPSFEKKETEEERPVAMRYGKLPKDLPSWFDEYDVDKDGQVSLYEFRKAGKDVKEKEALSKEFAAMDLNGDGLITADEYLRFTRKQSIETKVKAYDESGGLDRPVNGWGLGAPVDGKGDNPWRRGGQGGQGGPKGGDRGGDNGKGPDAKGGDRGGDKGGDRGDKGGGKKNKKE